MAREAGRRPAGRKRLKRGGLWAGRCAMVQCDPYAIKAIVEDSADKTEFKPILQARLRSRGSATARAPNTPHGPWHTWRGPH